MRLLVRGGAVVHAAGVDDADVLVVDGRIAALLGPSVRVDADEVVAATGCLVFPGFIDPHVHSRDPGQTEKEDFAHLTAAAAHGGVTTICEMPNALPPVVDAAIFEARAASREGRAHVDFAQWVMAVGEGDPDDLAGALDVGAVGAKIFWGYGLDRRTGGLLYNVADVDAADRIPPPSIGDVYGACVVAARRGGLVAAHCEDPAIIRAGAEIAGEGRGYDAFLQARPAVAEAAAVAAAAEVSLATGCRFHVVHLSTAAGVAAVRRARASGASLTAETCPQYLAFTAADFERLGPVMKVYPPIRDASDQAALWGAVADGTIASLGSDHAPHTLAEKHLPLERQPAGINGVETLVPFALDAMARGRLSPVAVARLLSTRTADILSVAPAKGRLVVGADADLTIVDPARVVEVDQAALHHKQKLSLFHGAELRGAPVATVVRGHLVMREGELATPAVGALVRARRSAA
jgi:dihydroorotase